MYWLTYFFEEPIYINFGTWISLGDININYGILLDSLSMVVMVPVGIVTLAVLIYALDYMRHDPNRNRFYIILSVFALFMTILVVSENYLMMFIGWEFVGVISYLLISFWNTRIAAMKSALSAILLNRMGDTLFVICIGCMLSFFHAVDFNTIELLVPHVDTTILNSLAIMLLIAATAKSAQLGLHGWLLSAMEGDRRSGTLILLKILKKINKYIKINILNIYSGTSKVDVILDTLKVNSKLKYNNKGNKRVEINKIFIRNYSKINAKRVVYYYDILNLSENNFIVLDYKYYYSILECSKDLKYTRGTISKYLDSNKLYKEQYLFSSKLLTKEELLKYNKYDNKTMEVITGLMLGDGHIRIIKTKGNVIENKARLEFTFAAKFLDYIKHLKFNLLKNICNDTSPTPWPNKSDMEPSQYWFSSLSTPFLFDLHKEWYKWDSKSNKYIKKLPDNIYDLLTPIGLAHWYMDDGYLIISENNFYLCTDNFTKSETEYLVFILRDKFNISCNIKKRRYFDKYNNEIIHYRIRLIPKSCPDFVNIIKPYIIPCMLYKINIK
jgi:hypothetical protein